MGDPLREDLLGYLLGALDPARQAEIEQHLSEDSESRRQLVLLSRALAPLDATREHFDPPAGLAARTCQLVAEHSAADTSRHEASMEPAATIGRPSAVRMRDTGLVSAGPERFRWQDLITVAGVLVAASLLLFPAIQGSREQSRLLACQNNLRELGGAMQRYSDSHGGFFPKLSTQGNLAAASVYAPILAESQLLPNDRVVLCPGAPLASIDSLEAFKIPTLEEIETAQSSDELRNMQETMGGSYGYSLGYEEGEQYCSTRNLHRSNFPIAADAPSDSLPNHMSENHGRLGQNVLFEDGHVAFTTSPRPSDLGGDNFYVNDNGEVAAGVDANDAVIGAGATPPIQILSQ
jgi:hypothetical protein